MAVEILLVCAFFYWGWGVTWKMNVRNTTDYRIDCIRTVADPQDRRRRLSRVYALLLAISERRGTDDQADVGDQNQATDGAMATGRGENA